MDPPYCSQQHTGLQNPVLGFTAKGINQTLDKVSNYFTQKGRYGTIVAVWPEKNANLPKNDFTTIMIDFDSFTKNANVVDLGKLNVAKGFKKLPKVQ